MQILGPDVAAVLSGHEGVPVQELPYSKPVTMYRVDFLHTC